MHTFSLNLPQSSCENSYCSSVVSAFNLVSVACSACERNHDNLQGLVCLHRLTVCNHVLQTNCRRRRFQRLKASKIILYFYVRSFEKHQYVRSCKSIKNRDMPPRKRVRSGALRYQLGNIGFRQLTQLITKAELLFTLSGDEDFTLFAPNDDALGNFLVNNPAIAESLNVNLKTGVTKPNLGMRKERQIVSPCRTREISRISS